MSEKKINKKTSESSSPIRTSNEATRSSSVLPKLTNKQYKYKNSLIFEKKYPNIVGDRYRNENSIITEASSINKLSSINPNLYITDINNSNNNNNNNINISLSKSPSSSSQNYVLNTIEENKKFYRPTQTDLDILNADSALINKNLISKLAKKYSIESKNENIFTKKLKKPKKVNETIKNNRYSKYDYLVKTKEIARMKYSSLIKSNAENLIKENTEKELIYLDETMKKLQIYKEQINSQFYNRYVENLRNLNIKLDHEKSKLMDILQELNKIIRENHKIETKINKIKTEKNFYEKWLILQIEVKNCKKVENPKEELKLYIGNYIFNNSEDFIEKFKSEENKNLSLLKEYDSNRKAIELLVEEKKKLNDQMTAENHKEDSKIKDKENELKLLKLRFQKLKDNKSILKKNPQLSVRKNNKKNKSIESDFALLHSSNNTISQKYGQLYSDIYNVYNTCINYLANKLDIVPVNFKRIGISKEVKMVEMLLIIEESINFLSERKIWFKYHINNYDSIMQEIQNKIDHEKKIENSRKMKQIEIQKYIQLKEKIDQKMKRVYYVPLRKVNMFPYNDFFKKNKKVILSAQDKEPSFSDFISDEDD